MRVANDAFRVISRSETEPHEESGLTTLEPRPVTGDEGNGLVRLLNDIDGLKHEIQERIRHADSVRQARALLMQEAARTEALNRRLAGLGIGPVGGLVTAQETTGQGSEWQHLELVRSRGAMLAGMEEPAAMSRVERSEDQAYPGAPQISGYGNGQAYARDGARDGMLEGARERGPAGVAPAVHSEQAEQMWKQCEKDMAEARRLLEEAGAQLERAAGKEDRAAAELAVAQALLVEVKRAADERVAEASGKWTQVNEAAQGLQERYEQASVALVEARARQDAASSDLTAARQELTTSYQFAAVAAQRTFEAREFFQKASRWAILATGISWALITWLAWLDFRQIVPVWAPGVLTVAILVIAFRLRVKQAEDN